MRAARILQMLLLLQNRGRLTSVQLAVELEVTPRTILRDVDALTEAGLPIIVFQGNQGGIELGFGYRTHLTGLAADEAEALAVMLAWSAEPLAALGLTASARRAASKLIEAMPEPVREKIRVAEGRFRFEGAAPDDPRLPAIADAIRNRNIVLIRTRTGDPVQIHPVALTLTADGWRVHDALNDRQVPMDDCEDINISAKQFTLTEQP